MARKKTFFLDQGETLGGAERFLLDFFQTLSPTEIKQIQPVVIGAKQEQYRTLLPEQIEIVPFRYTSLRGNIFRRFLVLFSLVRDAWKLRKLSSHHQAGTFFSNTPRTHFVMLLAKKLFFLPGRWIVMNHDFTVPRFLLRSIAGQADALIANSIPCREYLRKNISKRNQEKIKIIENGIDFARIPRASSPKKIERVLMLGRIDPRKGQIFAVEAADLLQERNPDVKFFIAGDSFEEDVRTGYYKNKIHQFVRERHLENLYFVGEVPNPFEVIADADCVLVLPTEPETFGRIVIEALALGKLVISFDETGPREILKNFERFLGNHKDSLFLVEKQNSMSLAERIGFFADHPEEVAQLTLRGREFVEKHFSIGETKKRLMNLLLEKNR
jgi:glycosyltransferase involved in cell wall biosynthesis